MLFWCFLLAPLAALAELVAYFAAGHPAAPAFDWQTILTHAATGAVSALGLWLMTGGRKAIANWGKTDLEVKVAELEEALVELKAAQATPDKTDDIAAAARVAKIKRDVVAAKRLKAVLDGFAAEPSGE